jgi:serine phosphatase RsbU (regulator of sigma subunit)
MRVVLVEDDDGDAFLFEELLQDADLDVEVVRRRSVAAAEDAMLDGVDCVVLDLDLPDADGLAALHRLRRVAPRVPTLVLTGIADSGRGLEAVAAGAQDYLVKGRVDGELLVRAIRYAVERQRAERVQDELRAAQLHAAENARLERGLLAQPVVVDPRIGVATGYRPGRQQSLLGGDFFDVLERPDGTLHVLIGDVSGHDPDAAALGVCLRVAWRTLILGDREAGRVLPTLAEVLIHERLSEEVFATACMVSVMPDRRRAHLRLAGHPAPILVADGGAGELSSVGPGPPLGVGGSADAWPAASIALPEAWELVLYTDGLIEGRTGAGDQRLGSEGLVRLVAEDAPAADRGRSARALIERLISTALRLNGGDLTDDVAVLVISQGRDG